MCALTFPAIPLALKDAFRHGCEAYCRHEVQLSRTQYGVIAVDKQPTWRPSTSKGKQQCERNKDRTEHIRQDTLQAPQK